MRHSSRRGRIIGSTLADRMLDAGTGHRIRQPLHWTALLRRERPAAPAYSLIGATCSIRTRFAAAVQGPDIVFHLAAERGHQDGLKHLAGPRAEHHRDLQRPGGNARRRVDGCFLLDRLGLWRAVRVSHPGDLPRFPCRRRCMRGRSSPGGLVSAYVEGFSFSAWVFVSSPSSRALHARARLRFLQTARQDRAAAAHSRQRPAEEVVPLRPGLRRRDAARQSRKSRRASTSSISARRVRDR